MQFQDHSKNTYDLPEPESGGSSQSGPRATTPTSAQSTENGAWLDKSRPTCEGLPDIDCIDMETDQA